MADSRLERIAADARRRGWATSLHDTRARTELIVVPTISNPEQQGSLGLGFGVTLGGGAVACWVWEAWTGSLIDPWQESGPAGGPMFQEPPLEQEPQRFHLVASLECSTGPPAATWPPCANWRWGWTPWSWRTGPISSQSMGAAAMRKPHRRPWGKEPVRVELPQWTPSHRQDQLNTIRSELEAEGHDLPIGKTDAAEFDDAAR